MINWFGSLDSNILIGLWSSGLTVQRVKLKCFLCENVFLTLDLHYGKCKIEGWVCCSLLWLELLLLSQVPHLCRVWYLTLKETLTLWTEHCQCRLLSVFFCLLSKWVIKKLTGNEIKCIIKQYFTVGSKLKLLISTEYVSVHLCVCVCVLWFYVKSFLERW